MGDDLIPLSLVTTKSTLYRNVGAQAKDLWLWAAAHGNDGKINLLNVYGATEVISLTPAEGVTTIRIAVDKDHGVQVQPGEGGVIAVRLTLGGP